MFPIIMILQLDIITLTDTLVCVCMVLNSYIGTLTFGPDTFLQYLSSNKYRKQTKPLDLSFSF